MISKIFMMKNRPDLGLDDLYVLNTDDGRFFELSPSGCETVDWIKSFKLIGNGFSIS